MWNYKAFYGQLKQLPILLDRRLKHTVTSDSDLRIFASLLVCVATLYAWHPCNTSAKTRDVVCFEMLRLHLLLRASDSKHPILSFVPVARSWQTRSISMPGTWRQLY
jgi:hypothetical protein